MSFKTSRKKNSREIFLDLQYKAHTEYLLGCLGYMNFWFAVNPVGFENIYEVCFFHTQNEFILINCTAELLEIKI